MEISNLSDAEFKTLVIKMLKKLIKKTQAEMKVTLSEIKKCYRESTVKGRKPGIKSMFLNTQGKKNQNSKKKKESKKKMRKW